MSDCDLDDYENFEDEIDSNFNETIKEVVITLTVLTLGVIIGFTALLVFA